MRTLQQLRQHRTRWQRRAVLGIFGRTLTLCENEMIDLRGAVELGHLSKEHGNDGMATRLQLFKGR